MVPFFDPSLMHQLQRAELTDTFARVLESGRYILGEEVAKFEAEAARFLGLPFAVGVSSGTDALVCALLALGIGPGDEVITSPFTFVATGESILRVGATPVFVDIEPQSFCLDPTRVEAAITSATRAILPVHLYGWPDRIEELRSLCETHGLWLVEDACQAFGAEVQGRCAGGFGVAGCFSFFPTKPLGGLGDGGLVVTRDRSLADRIVSLRSHGLDGRGAYQSLGGNFRLDALHAACLSVKLPTVGQGIEVRARIVARYRELLAIHPRLELCPLPPDRVRSAHAVFTLRIPQGRDLLVSYLRDQGIGCAVYYPRLLSDHPLFLGRSKSHDLPSARRARQEVLSLPCYWGLTENQQTEICERLLSWNP